MSLWKFSNYNKYGNVRNRIVHTEGSQLSINPKGFGKFICAQRFLYELEESFIPPRIYEGKDGERWIVPQWIKVHPKTTMDDIKIIKKQKRVEKDIYTVQSGSNEYKVRHDPETDHYTCNCQGYWRVLDKSKGCKHIQEIKNK